MFRAQDAYLTLGVANNSLWERMCGALDQPDLARDPRFDTADARRRRGMGSCADHTDSGE